MNLTAKQIIQKLSKLEPDTFVDIIVNEEVLNYDLEVNVTAKTAEFIVNPDRFELVDSVELEDLRHAESILHASGTW